MKLHNIALYFILYAVFTSCIALEDNFDPSINSMDINEESIFFYKDTFNLQVTFSDNFLIEEATVSIGKVNDENTSTVKFEYDSTYEVNARAIVIDSALVVPPHVSIGTYYLSLRNKDAGGNIIEDTTFFQIGTDTLGPSVDGDVDVVSAIPGNTEATVFCRGERIYLDGMLIDNIGLAKVSVQIGDSYPILFPLQGESVNINSIVQKKLFIPNDIVNGTTNLTLIIEDLFGNTSTYIKQLTINCDDVAPNFYSNCLTC